MGYKQGIERLLIEIVLSIWIYMMIIEFVHVYFLSQAIATNRNAKKKTKLTHKDILLNIEQIILEENISVRLMWH